MELISFAVIVFAIYIAFSVLKSIFKIAYKNPFTFLFVLVGLGFLFGDDDCDV